MTGRDVLTPLLASLGIYSLKAGGGVDRELAAYRAGLDALAGALDALEADLFVERAEPRRLAVWEGLLGFPQMGSRPVERRRRRILGSLALDQNAFTPGDMLAALASLGLDAQIREDYQARRLVISSRRLLPDFTTVQEIIAGAAELLPAHLEAVFAFGGMSWELFEMDYPTWQRFDGEGHSFDWLDAVYLALAGEEEEGGTNVQQQHNAPPGA